MGKYNEVMSRVELTPEAKNRILANISRTMAEKPGFGQEPIAFTRKTILWKQALPIAAALLLILFGAFMARRIGQTADIGDDPVPLVSTNGPDAADIAENSEYYSPESLEAAAGFPLEELQALPFAAETVSYDLKDGIAEAALTGEGKWARFRKTVGERDLSDSVLSAVRSVEAEEIPVLIGGNGELFTHAFWRHGGYSYSLELSEGVPEETIIGIITHTVTGTR